MGVSLPLASRSSPTGWLRQTLTPNRYTPVISPRQAPALSLSSNAT
ncbi:TPA: hypothetical protein QB122_002120 [Pasteurella multocida]|nr:hypothetical protein [Pasteurella multocida]HDR0909070.1 hypothetical protein [Pasteurella multocida]HDR0936775.1 hypothetical protein [Pasteurella multocida]HDR0940993.1 hypothetical protein [Pasteurella multocida]HDR0943083.1 hypothetical protein [Pasteurella multocida]